MEDKQNHVGRNDTPSETAPAAAPVSASAKPNLGAVIAGGFIATVLVTFLVYVSNGAGWTRIHLAGAMAALLNGGRRPEMYSNLWWVGLLLHLLNGSVLFPLLYVYFVYPVISGPPFLRGALSSIGLWILFEAVLMPLSGRGFFGARSHHRALAVLEPLALHLVYGLILGAASTPEPAPPDRGTG